MYLLSTTELSLHEFHGVSTPDYAILSHTWTGKEVSFEEIYTGNQKPQFFKRIRKIKSCCSVAAADGYDWLWIDTCCIDKSSSAELSEAINSMYRWYKEAGVCYAYLADLHMKPSHPVPDSDVDFEPTKKFRDSRWFKRGWTLQELLAPSSVVFYDRAWAEIGTKVSLDKEICAATGISIEHLQRPHMASVAQKMSWASERETTRAEDMAYCLLGLFDVNMPLLYGEGLKAFQRLQEEIIRSSTDDSVFAWSDQAKATGMLAREPANFRHARNVVPNTVRFDSYQPYIVTSLGLSMKLNCYYPENLPNLKHHIPNVPEDTEILAAFLGCIDETTSDRFFVWLTVERDPGGRRTRRATRLFAHEMCFFHYENLRKARIKPFIDTFYIHSKDLIETFKLKSSTLSMRENGPHFLSFRKSRTSSEELHLLKKHSKTPVPESEDDRQVVFNLTYNDTAKIEFSIRGAEMSPKIITVDWNFCLYTTAMKLMVKITNGSEDVPFASHVLIRDDSCLEARLWPDRYLWATLKEGIVVYGQGERKERSWIITMEVTNISRTQVFSDIPSAFDHTVLL